VIEGNSTLDTQPFWRRALRFCVGFEPMRHAWWETLIFRIVIAQVTWVSSAGPSRFHSQPAPHGLAAWGLDFSWVGSEDLARWFVPLIGACLLIYILLPLVRVVPHVVNWITGIVLLPPLCVSFAHGTLGNSQGAIGHTAQIVTVALIAQCLASVWAAFRRDPSRLPNGYNAQQLAADWTRQLIAATYVVSAISKLVISNGNWWKEAPYFGLQIAKATGQAYYEWLAPPDNASWLAQFFIDHPLVAQLFIGIGLPLELFAFLALYNRRSALVFGLALYSFHATVTEMMHLGFVFHKLLLIALFVNPVWWAAAFFSYIKCRMLSRR
jgi:hypothetical protein